MTSFSHQVEQHILEHQARQGRIDEMLAGTENTAAVLQGKQWKTAEQLEEEELARAGPMGIWDAVAQRLEKLVERAGG